MDPVTSKGINTSNTVVVKLLPSQWKFIQATEREVIYSGGWG